MEVTIFQLIIPMNINMKIHLLLIFMLKFIFELLDLFN